MKGPPSAGLFRSTPRNARMPVSPAASVAHRLGNDAGFLFGRATVKCRMPHKDPAARRECARNYRKRKMLEPAYAERQLRFTREWRSRNPAKCAKTRTEWALTNKDRREELNANWRRRHPAKRAFWEGKRRAIALQATPAWANLELIELIYAEAQHRGMQVDHIIPLQGKQVCGLHVHTNMQLLDKSANARKGRKLIVV